MTTDSHAQAGAPPLPLDGIVVVSIEQAIAAPLASRYLGHLGARVIKVERPDTGDFARAYDRTVKGESSHFVWANANKESVELDLKSEFGVRALEALLERADVFIQNLAPGALERMGLGAEALLERYPRLVVTGISGYGGSGPYRSAKAYDLLLQSETGVLAITGTEDTPSKTGIPVADISAAMYAYSGILAALFERERTGRGQFVDITLLDSLTEWMGFPRYFTVYGGKSPARTGAYHAAIAPYGPYASANGGQVFLAVQNEREWRNFCTEVLGRPELVDDPRFGSNADRSENRDELTAIIEGAFADSSVDELLERLDRANIANARMRDVAGAAEHPQLKARDRFRTLAIPGGEVEAIRPPMLNDHRETRMDPVPALGEHTESILEWIGLGQERELQP